MLLKLPTCVNFIHITYECSKKAKNILKTSDGSLQSIDSVSYICCAIHLHVINVFLIDHCCQFRKHFIHVTYECSKKAKNILKAVHGSIQSIYSGT
jgi:hypothetical protein